jgi:hypothetical protein
MRFPTRSPHRSAIGAGAALSPKWPPSRSGPGIDQMSKPMTIRLGKAAVERPNQLGVARLGLNPCRCSSAWSRPQAGFVEGAQRLESPRGRLSCGKRTATTSRSSTTIGREAACPRSGPVEGSGGTERFPCSSSELWPFLAERLHNAALGHDRHQAHHCAEDETLEPARNSHRRSVAPVRGADQWRSGGTGRFPQQV